MSVEDLVRRLNHEATRKAVRQSYDISDLVCGAYGSYLGAYQPRKPKQKRKTTKQQLIGDFETLRPYTITIGGYLRGSIDAQRLWSALRLRASDSREPGSFSRLVSPKGEVYEAGWPLDRMVWANKHLPNHTCVLMWLPEYAKPLLLRVSTRNFGVVGCKTDEDLITAWNYMVGHVNALHALGEEVRRDADTELELTHSYGGMRNYSFNVGYPLDVGPLGALIPDRYPEFSVRRNPSVQTHLYVDHPREDAIGPSRSSVPSHSSMPSSSSTPSASESRSSNPSESRMATSTAVSEDRMSTSSVEECRVAKSNTSRRKQRTSTPKPHIFHVFHTGICLYSGKGDLEECKRVFERFRSLIMTARSEVEVTTQR
jgi:hypothetical protein